MDSAEVSEIKRHFEATADGFRSDVADVKRHFNVVAERLEGRIQLLAEGIEGVRFELSAFKEEVRQEFEETRAMIRLSYTELDRRLRTLEGRQDDLESPPAPRRALNPYKSSSRTGVSASFQAVSYWARANAASAVFFWASRLFESP